VGRACNDLAPVTDAIAQPPRVTVRPGETFAGKYVIERELGAGGMGVVVAARHLQLGQTVAIKFLSVPTAVRPEAEQRFLAEAQAAARLRSEHVARVMDAGIDDQGRHYIVMEHLQGADLAEVLRGTGPLPIGDAVGYLLQACEGIAEAHASGIIHRDLKPENLFVTRRIDGSPLVKVLDFGVSKTLVADDARPQLAITPGGALVGSPLYMAPEQMRVPTIVDVRCDVWALGVILYELLTDRIPFAGVELPEVIAGVLTGTPVPLQPLRPELPAALVEVVMGALEKDTARRTANVGAFAKALRPWAPPWARDSAARVVRTLGMGGLGGTSRDFGPTPDAGAAPPATTSVAPANARDRRNRALVVGAGLFVLAAIGVAASRGTTTTPVVAPASTSVRDAALAPASTSVSHAPEPTVPAPGAVPPPAARELKVRPAPADATRPPKLKTKRRARPLDPLDGRH
jgi:eukaryotic-like serine/threonine-protein kinase